MFWRLFLFPPLPTILLLWVEQVSQEHIVGVVLEAVDFLAFCKALLIWLQQVEEGELLVTEVRVEQEDPEAHKMVLLDHVAQVELQVLGGHQVEMVEQALTTEAMAIIQMEVMAVMGAQIGQLEVVAAEQG